MKHRLTLTLVHVLVGLACAASAQNPFASSYVNTPADQPTNLGGGYDTPAYANPSAVLGQPTTQIQYVYDGNKTYDRSLAFPANGTDPEGNDLITAIGNSSTGSGAADQPGNLTVTFNTPIVHSDSHWYGMDFIVFGNQGFIGQNGSYVQSPNQDMSTFYIGDGSTFSSLPTVSVSADDVTFYTLTPAGSVLFPENPYAWAGVSAANPSGWDHNHLLDFTKPVNPALTAGSFAGQSVDNAANVLYDGSAGGTPFSLASLANTSIAATGIRYLRFSGFGTVDAVSQVSAAPEPGMLWVFALGSGSLSALLWRRQRQTRAAA